MGTLSDLKGRIATDLTRTDLTSQIANAVSDAIAFYQAERFWFNTSRALTFSTVASTSDYDSGTSLATGVTCADLIRIDAVFAALGTSMIPLDRDDPADFELLNNVSNGFPCVFTYVDQTLRLWPTPNTAYSVRIYGHYTLAAPGDNGSNAWTTDAEELIRSHAKLLLYTDLLEDADGAARMSAKVPVLLNRLRGISSSRSSTGIIQPVDF